MSLAQPIICPILVGRDAQLATLDRLIAEVHAGAGRTALITGEAGVGKSRLVAQARERFLTRAKPQMPLALAGRCFEPDRVLPYAPLIDIFHLLISSHPRNEVATLLGSISELSRILPELAADNPPPAAQIEPEQERRRIIRAILQCFAQLAARGPLLLIVEDLHWCDEASLEVLLALARRLPSRVLLLLTYRADEAPPELTALVVALDRERLASDLALAPFNPGEVDTMLRAIFNLVRPVRSEFLDALYTVTEGNPFFIEETLKSLIANGEIFYTDGQWDRKPLGMLRLPRSVQVAVQRRLDALSPPAREVITLAAVAGRRFDFNLLQVLTGFAEPELLRLIKELIAAQLVVEESADLFAFRHELTRQAVEADLLARERRALHRSVAEALERLSGATHLADLAYHFFAAEVWDRALEYAQRAGQQTQALYAPRAAAENYTHAIEAAQRLGDVPAALYRARGQMYEMLGAFEVARDDYTAALAAARAAGDRMAEWQELLDLGFLWIGSDYDRAGAFLRDALTLAREIADPATIAYSLNRLGNWHANIEQPRQARSFHHEARDLFERVGDRHGLAMTLDLLGTTSYMAGDAIGGAHYYEQAAVLFRELDDRTGLISCLAMYAMRGASYVFATVACPPTELADSLSATNEALRLAQQSDWRAGEASVQAYLGLGLGARGEYARALDAFQHCREIAGAIEHRHWLMVAHWGLGALLLDLLDLPAASAELERALAMGRDIGQLFSVHFAVAFLAETYVAQGDLARAAALLAELHGAEMRIDTMALRLVAYARAKLALAYNQPNDALAIADQLIDTATPNGPATAIPDLWLLRGEALHALGRAPEAERALLSAASVAQTQGLAPTYWRAQIALGQLYRSRNQRDLAEAAFAAARATIEQLAIDLPDATLREQFRARASAQIPQTAAPTPRRAAKQAFAGLTERERQVATLVAQGNSNRAIADTLVVSERTIEKHIENVRSKLGFTSRAQIAVWAVERGLARPVEPQPKVEDRE